MKPMLKKSITLNASITKVWDALINPIIIKQYFFGTDTISNWKQGSPIVWKGSWEGKTYEDKGTILKIVPEKLLEANYWSSFSGKPDIPENYAIFSYELSANNGKTILTIGQEDNFTTPEQRENAWQHWDVVIKGLKEVVEN